MTTSDWLPAQWLDREEAPSVSVSCSVVPDSLRPHGLQPTSFLCPWDFPGKDTGVGCHFLLQGEEAPKHFPKPNLYPKKVIVTLMACCPSDPLVFWIPVKLLNLKSMLSKLMKCTGNCNACCRYWSTEWAQFSMITPDRKLHNPRVRSWTNWAMKFCLIRHSHLTSRQPTTTSSSILTTFWRENISTTSRRQKMLSKSSQNPEALIFMLQE